MISRVLSTGSVTLCHIICACFLLVVGIPLAHGQLAGLSAIHDDSYREWSIITSDSSDWDAGLLEVTFVQDQSIDWSYSIGDISGDIRVKAGSDGRLWELTSPDRLVTMRRVWVQDDTEWTISDGRQSITIKTRYGNSAEEWHITDESDGYLDIFAMYAGDSRDWVIEETLGQQYPVELQLAALFMVMYVTTTAR